jgi:hypothetical protein
MKRRQKYYEGYRNTQTPASSSSEHKRRKQSVLLSLKDTAKIRRADACCIRVQIRPAAYSEVKTIPFRQNCESLVVLTVKILQAEINSQGLSLDLSLRCQVLNIKGIFNYNIYCAVTSKRIALKLRTTNSNVPTISENAVVHVVCFLLGISPASEV